MKLGSGNRAGSWKAWLQSYESSIEFISLRLGTENIYGQQFNVHRGRMKSLSYSIVKDELGALNASYNILALIVTELMQIPNINDREVTGFSQIFVNGLLAMFWVICCGMNCKWVLSANCVVAHIIDS